MTLTATAAGERINRYLARRGVGSRRAADVLVDAGRVTVNGASAVPGQTVDPVSDAISVDGFPVPHEAPPRRTVLVNKPVGFVSTRRDPEGRPTVLDLLDDPAGLVPVGRLDADSHGLMLLSSDGDLAYRLTHPRHGVEKTYRVAINGRVTSSLVERLTRGVDLPDGPAVPRAVRQSGADMIDVVMAEGRKREVRRMVMALGFDVVDLERTAFGPLGLDGLPVGRWRDLTARESRALYDAAGLGW